MKNQFYNIHHVINANDKIKMLEEKSTFVQWCADALRNSQKKLYSINRIADILTNN